MQQSNIYTDNAHGSPPSFPFLPGDNQYPFVSYPGARLLPVSLPGSVSQEGLAVRVFPPSQAQRIGGGMSAGYTAQWQWEEDIEEDADLAARLDQISPTQESDAKTTDDEQEEVAA